MHPGWQRAVGVRPLRRKEFTEPMHAYWAMNCRVARLLLEIAKRAHLPFDRIRRPECWLARSVGAGPDSL